MRNRSVNTPGRGPMMPVCGLVAVALLGVMAGCEVDSYLDASNVGRWERTPVVLPILDRLSIVEGPEVTVAGLSQVQAEDLVPVIHEYVIGPGDIVSLSIYELLQPGLDSVQVRRVDNLGIVRLPVIGPVQVVGLTPSQLEVHLAEVLEERGVLRDATVTALVQNSLRNTFSVIGEPRTSGTAIGTYGIPKSDFRLMDAMAMARGATGAIKRLFVIRQIMLTDQTRRGGEKDAVESVTAPERLTEDPVELIERLLNPDSKPESTGGPSDQPAAGQPVGASVPDGMLDQSQGAVSPWVYAGDRWVKIHDGPANGGGAPATQPAGLANASDIITQRIIEVPYDKLLEGDMRYNIVIRPGDVIRVPPPVIGNVYIGGSISRPGTYALPGDKDLTLKQLVFAAGNISSLAIPERVDLIRRVGKDQEAVVRLNLRAIFHGTQPDFYLKPNDTINIGTNFMSTPLAVLRNGFRISYGFGFILDRNFGPDVYGPVPQDPR